MLETQQTEGHAPCPTGRPLSPSPEPTPPQTPSLQTGEALGTSTPLRISKAVGLPQGREKLRAADIRQACLMDRVNSTLPPELESKLRAPLHCAARPVFWAAETAQPP